ncbi:MAG: phenylacetate-CoA oxygenase subunit PaaC [Burkholderiales bacterium]|nr:phenylacetate-CoA oxygenase subunit PaaC [Burkholderiales bacterium]
MNRDEHAQYLLRLADNALVLSHRLSEWCGHGPVLEEDLALANISLDLLGQARLLYQQAAALEGGDADENRYAYFRDAAGFRNFTALELPNSGVASAGAADGDYAFTIVRNTLYSAYAVELWRQLSASNDAELAAIAAKSLKEASYHLRHGADWLLRFGDGTDESHRRAQHALDALLPYTNEWFTDDALDTRAAAAGIGVAGSALREAWLATMRTLVDEATLRWPGDSQFRSTGRQGLHSEHLGLMLAEMQSLARAHPHASW